ncbi:HEAT repeat domain-containing protein [Calothrix sp. 336/3]|uniref:HEAT repeat domain-containing protein n=1 Tax=Calothrix sp. 336/3 TaxID=1337936 RepID=UPI00069B0DF8|nr:hypothetical protein [Calothrix sp. 336/3]
MTNQTNYQPPVNQLLALDNSSIQAKTWYNYPEMFGLGKEDIPELIRMAVDRDLDSIDSHIHPWRSLAQLGAESAVIPLMELFHEWEDNDLVSEEMPKVYGMIGRVAISPLQTYLADVSHKLFPRVTAINSLVEIAKQHPDTHPECIAVLTQQLTEFTSNLPELNSFLVASLLELTAIDAASIIKTAFHHQAVAEDITGTWEEVAQGLGVDDAQVNLFVIPTPNDNLETNAVLVAEIPNEEQQATIIEETNISLEISTPQAEIIEDTPELPVTESEEITETCSPEIPNPQAEIIEDTSELTVTESEETTEISSPETSTPQAEIIEDTSELTVTESEEITETYSPEIPTPQAEIIEDTSELTVTESEGTTENSSPETSTPQVETIEDTSELTVTEEITEIYSPETSTSQAEIIEDTSELTVTESEAITETSSPEIPTPQAEIIEDTPELTVTESEETTETSSPEIPTPQAETIEDNSELTVTESEETSGNTAITNSTEKTSNIPKINEVLTDNIILPKDTEISSIENSSQSEIPETQLNNKGFGRITSSTAKSKTSKKKKR